MTGHHHDVTESTSHTDEGFADFFTKKIDDIQATTAGLMPPQVISQASASMATFEPFMEVEVPRITATSPIKSSVECLAILPLTGQELQTLQ